ncbi:MAG: GNAT family N-acetyltransferase [Candidatus Eisenbacteria bacterium]|mgnify:CR=1 FL=1|nr:GNAT family N-acetyltransferase [Candidatus Eisenbacteria bacterium]
MSLPLIHPLTTVADIQAAVDLQKKVWQAQDRDLVPVTEVIAARENGGIVLGARDGGRMVGFVFSMVGRREGQTYQYSRMLAVDPEWRGRGLGVRLKLAQKAAALALGDRRMEWTFDPLEGRNAALNLHRLGARVCHYYRDFYGARTSRFDLGIPTDRLRAEWDLTRDVESTGPEPHELPRGLVGFVASSQDPLAGPGEYQPPLPDSEYWIPVPIPFQPIREEAPGQALAWRMSLREAFEAAFALGLVGVDFQAPTTAGVGHGYYRLRPPHSGNA